MMYDKVEALLTVLQLRSMVQRDGNHMRLPSSIDEKLRMMNRSRSGLWKSENLPTKHYSSAKDIRLMRVWNNQGLLPLPPKCPNLSALHLLGNRDNDSLFRISDNLFEQMKDLRVLKLKRFGNEYLPKSASCLHHLKVLKLERCPHLHTLLPSLQNFDKLEYLELSYEGYDSSLTIPDDFFQHMNHLQFLYLKSMQITSLPSSISMLHSLRHLKLINCKSLRRMPDEFFGHLSQLRILELRGNDKMESLPSLLFNIVHLKKLIIHGSSSLKMRFLPHLQKLSALEVLDLEGCSSLEDIADVTSSLGSTLPNLRKLYISNIDVVRRLDLKDCQSLESVSLSQLTSLEALDLSCTKFKTLPQGVSDASVLRHLDMLNMNEIRKINWNDISTTLEELNLSQSDTWNSANDIEQPGDRGGARIRVSTSKLLQSFSPSSKLWDSKCFSRFHVYISPYQEDKQGRGKSIHLQRKLLIYKDINFSIQTQDSRRLESHFDRCLEIRGGHRSPNGIHRVLSRAELLILCDNAFVQRLSDLGNVDKMKEMKECRIERCEQMEMFFEGDNANSDCLSHLENIWMSNLARVRSVCEGTYRSRSFARLKHIHLDNCLRLVTVFSSSVFLQSLETLEIKYCSKLKTVFDGDTAAEGSLQRLHTVFLWELPKLESICRGTFLSALKKLKVRGCGMLKKLPLQAGEMAASSTSTGGVRVEVEGESEWWDRLKWEDERIQHLIN